ncbi:MAG: LamG-like jellyroll fold domain-containing protein [Thermoplasmata archaeon]
MNDRYILVDIKKSKIICSVILVIILVVTPIFMSFPSYFYSASMDNGISYVVPVNKSIATSLNNITNFLNNNPDGNVFWFPSPPLFGASGSITDRSYIYPWGSDGPFSTELFSFLVGDHADSLINSKNYYALGKISALIGVRYFIFYGASVGMGLNLEKSGYFSLVYNDKYSIILQNNFYNGMVQASTNALLISGGLSLYAKFLPYINKFYGNLSSPIPFMTDTYPFFNLTNNNYSILASNISQLSFELEVMLAGYEYMYFPFNYINKNIGWNGGDIADTDGYNWNGFAGNLPNYTWQSTYTVNDGVIYTNTPNMKFDFNVLVSNNVNDIMVRVFVYPGMNTNFSIYISHLEYNITLPKTNISQFIWINLGNTKVYSSKVDIKLISHGSVFINAIDIVPINKWINAINKTKFILKSKTIYLLPNINYMSNISLPSMSSYTISTYNNHNNIYLINNNTLYSIKNDNNTLIWSKLSNLYYVPMFNGNESTMNVHINGVINNNTLNTGITVNALVKIDKFVRIETIFVANTYNATNFNFNIDLFYMMPWINIKTTGLNIDMVYQKKLELHVWYLLSVSINDTKLNLYLNGSLVDSMQLSNVSFYNTSYITIGKQFVNNYMTSFQGDIASILLMNGFYNKQNIYNELMNITTYNVLFFYFFNYTKVGNILSIYNITYNSINLYGIVSHISLIFFSLAFNYSKEPLLLNAPINGTIILTTYRTVYGQICLVINPLIENYNMLLINYSLENTPFGNIVSFIKIEYNPKNTISNIYIIVSGFGCFAIVDGSYMQNNKSIVYPLPAVEGGEGYVINVNKLNNYNNSNITLKYNVYWFQNSQILLENYISYITLCIVLFIIIYFKFKKHFKTVYTILRRSNKITRM